MIISDDENMEAFHDNSDNDEDMNDAVRLISHTLFHTHIFKI